MYLKREILEASNQGLRVFEHYLSHPLVLGKRFKNPFYEDRKASCYVYFNRERNLYFFKDFGDEHYRGDCFDFVGFVVGLNPQIATQFVAILQRICTDLLISPRLPSLVRDKLARPAAGKLSASVASPSPSPSPCVLSPSPSPRVPSLGPTVQPSFLVEEGEFGEFELAFWGRYGIGLDTLRLYQVKSLRSFECVTSQGRKIYLKAEDGLPLFCYWRESFCKLYAPLSKQRFLYAGSLPSPYCFGLEQLAVLGSQALLPGLLFIAAGEKDVMSLQAHGFQAVCFGSETVQLPEGLIEAWCKRFEYVVLLYDVDATGRQCSLLQVQRFHRLGLKRLLLPLDGGTDSKDVSDFFAQHLVCLGDGLLDLAPGREALLALWEAFLEDEKDRQVVSTEELPVLLPNEACLESLFRCEIDLKNPPAEQACLISINEVPLASSQNLFCITGGEGSGKSNFAAALLAGLIQTQEELSMDTLGYQLKCNSDQKAVILYDTEQSPLQLFRNTNNTLRRAKLSEQPDFFKAYYLCRMNREERLQSICDSLAYFSAKHGGIHAIVIDGVADLVSSTNDELECVSLVNRLYQLASSYNTCVICVLHLLPGGQKMRGHLGSELQRKAAGIVSIEREGNSGVSNVVPIKAREGNRQAIPIVQFAWSLQLDMHSYCGCKGGQNYRLSTSSQQAAKLLRKHDQLLVQLKTIFANKSSLGYAELSNGLCEHLQVSERTSKNYIKLLLEEKKLLKDANAPAYQLNLEL